MKIFKFFLYFVCLITVSWMCLFFGGPTLITQIIESYTKSQVNVYSVEVRPNLNVKIGRLELEPLVPDGQESIKGFMRAIEIDWHFSNGRPFAEITTGPTVLGEIFVADGLIISIPEFPNINSDSVPISIKIKDVRLGSFGRLDTLSLNGAFSNVSKSISGLLFETDILEINSASRATIGSVSGTVSDIRLDLPLSDQELQVDFVTEKVTSLHPQVEIKNLNGNFNHKSGSFVYSLNSEAILFPSLFSSFGFTAFDGIYKNHQNGFTAEGSLGVKNADLFDDKISINDFNGDFILPIDQSFTAQVSGALDRFEIKVNDQHAGQLPEGIFEMDIAIERSPEALMSEASIGFMSSTAPTVQIENVSKATFKNINSILECVFNGCETSGLDLDYSVSVGNERISGNSFCYNSKCLPQDWSHKIRTYNTNKFFSVLSGLNIINPLTLAYFYASFLSGVPINDGHELNL